MKRKVKHAFVVTFTFEKDVSSSEVRRFVKDQLTTMRFRVKGVEASVDSQAPVSVKVTAVSEA